MVRFRKKSIHNEDKFQAHEHIPCCVAEDIHQLITNLFRPVTTCVGFEPRRKRVVSFRQGFKRNPPTNKTMKKPFGILKNKETSAKGKTERRKRFTLKQEPSSDSETSHESEEPKAFFRKDISADSEGTHESQESGSSSILCSWDSQASSLCSNEGSNSDSDDEDSPSSDSKFGFFRKKKSSSPDKVVALNDYDEARDDAVSNAAERKSCQLLHKDSDDEAGTKTLLADSTEEPLACFGTSGRQSHQEDEFDQSLLTSFSKHNFSSLEAPQGSEYHHPAIQSPVLPKQGIQRSVGKKLMNVFKKTNLKTLGSSRAKAMAIHPKEDDTISCVSANSSRMMLHLPSFLSKGKDNKRNINSSSSVNLKNTSSSKVSNTERKWGNDDKSCVSKREQLLYPSPKDYVTNYTRSDFVKRHQQLRKKEKKKYTSSNAATISNVTGFINSGDKMINCSIKLNSGIKTAKE